MHGKLYKGTVGTAIDVDTLLPVAILASASSVDIKVKKPDGTIVTWNASIVSNTSVIRHILAANEIDLNGKYSLQANVTLNGNAILGDTTILPVFNNFE